VVMTCIQELHKYKDYGRLQDVLLMGGAMNLNDINPDSLKIIAGRLINCYTRSDLILKYALKMADLFNEPIGINEISFEGIEVENYNISELIKGHSMYMKELTKILRHVEFNMGTKRYLNVWDNEWN